MRTGLVKAKRGEVRRRREALGITQAELADRIGCHKKNVENAEASRPQRVTTLREIAEGLGCKLEDLLPQRRLPRRSKAADNPPGAHENGFRLRGGAPAAGRRLFGREHDEREIKARLTDGAHDEAAGVVVLHGVAGVGKSSLLNRLARDSSLGELFPGGGLWAAVGETPDVLGLLTSWGQALRIPAQRLMRIDDAVATIRGVLQQRRMLILIDDVWTEAHAHTLHVAGPGSVILYTTRSPGLADRLAPTPAAAYPLRGLDKVNGVKLLAYFAPEVVRDHSGDCESLVDDVDGLPLALIVAGKMLHREWAAAGDVEGLLREIHDDARTLLSQPVPPDMADLLEQTTPNVAAVLRRSTAGLSDEMRLRFARLGAFAPTPAKFPLFYAAKRWELTEREAKAVAREFIDLGLLEVDRRGQYSIHPLMKALALHEWDMLDEARPD